MSTPPRLHADTQTNIVLPTPGLNLNAAPPAVVHGVVSLLYLDHFPLKYVATLPRYAFDEDYELDWDAPLDMDAAYGDAWLEAKIASRLRATIEGMRLYPLTPEHPANTLFPWIHDSAGIARLLGEVA